MTPALALEGVCLRLGGFALHGIDLAVAAGEILVVLGRNGAGKSVTLETIAGFHFPSAGRVRIGGRDVTRLPPEARRVGFVLQNFGLFPHLSVAGNIAIGLRGATRRERTRIMGTLLDRFGIGSIAARAPAGLSPGERQRVALARAVAAEPDVFLFDEPFSAIDAPTRAGLRRELRDFLRKAGLPAVFVTHDAADARALADSVAVMRQGRVIQAAPAQEVFARPASRFAAEALGFENLLPGRAVPSDGGFRRVMAGERALTVRAGAHGEVLLCIGAGDVMLSPPGAPAPDAPRAGPLNRLPARVLAVEDRQLYVHVELDCGFPLVAALGRQEARRLGLAPGAEVVAWIEAEAVHAISVG